MRVVELYEFVFGADTWYYTSGDEQITYLSNTYVPVPIGRGKAETRNELSKANLEVRLDVLDPISQKLLTTFTDAVLSLTLHIRDLDTATTSIGWKGRLANTKPSKDKLSLSFESVFTSLRRPGLRARYQKTCRHVLYGRGCNLNIEDFAVESSAGSVTGNVVVVSAAALQPDGWYIGGVLRAPDDTLGFIVDHVGSTLTLQRQIDSLIDDRVNAGYGNNYGQFYGGVNVKIYPGCDRLRQTCETKFSNLNNYGGFPWIPSRNPLDGSSIV